MSTPTIQDQAVLTDQAKAWLVALEQALGSGNQPDFDDLLLEESYWRDMVALTWDTCQFWGRDKIRVAINAAAPKMGFGNLRLDDERSAPRLADFVGEPYVEMFFAFDTKYGKGKGFARLSQDATAFSGLRAMMVATNLMELHVAPEPKGRHHRLGFEPAFPGQNYGEWNAAKRDFSEKDPDVLIIGGSHSGLCVGARFERKGTSYLIVEKNAKPGDMWRGRYEALALHTPTVINHLPYIPMPDHWSMFTPKDQWADFCDAYALLMNLNLWGNTEARGCSFDEATMTWNVELKLADGSTRVMHPKHVVLAVGGVGGRPRIPELPGLKEFKGDVKHSSAFASGAPYTGKKVMVVGASTTAHDICLDLAMRGADTMMAQRGATCVVNISEVLAFGADYARVSGDEADMLRSAMPYPLWIKRAKVYTEGTEKSHKELHDGLRRAGQRLTIGHDDTGWSIKLFREAAGYYLNVGASEAIVDGRIKMQDYDEIDKFVPQGALLKDGSIIELDAVILCTGYYDLENDIAALLGDDIAKKVGRCNGVDPEYGEYRTMSRPTAQPHLWLINGGIPDSRKSSDHLAMQVIAPTSALRQSAGRGRRSPL